MPQPHERYNRFMKFCAIGYSNDKRLDTGSGFMEFDLDSGCEICFKKMKRSKLTYVEKNLRCEDCCNDLYLQWRSRTTSEK